MKERHENANVIPSSSCIEMTVSSPKHSTNSNSNEGTSTSAVLGRKESMLNVPNLHATNRNRQAANRPSSPIFRLFRPKKSSKDSNSKDDLRMRRNSIRSGRIASSWRGGCPSSARRASFNNSNDRRDRDQHQHREEDRNQKQNDHQIQSIVVSPKVGRVGVVSSSSSSSSITIQASESRSGSGYGYGYGRPPPISVPRINRKTSGTPPPSLQVARTSSFSSSGTLPLFYRRQSSSVLITEDDDEDESHREEVEDYTSYFLKTDFMKDNWLETISLQGSTESISLGFLSIMAATVVIHPIIFVTGAATAVWAVGVVHAFDKGYDFFSDGQFKNMFWADREVEQFEQLKIDDGQVDEDSSMNCKGVTTIQSMNTDTTSISTVCCSRSTPETEGLASGITSGSENRLPSTPKTTSSFNGSDGTCSSTPPSTNVGDRDESSNFASPLSPMPISPLYSPAPKASSLTHFRKHVKVADDVIQSHFPPLEHEVVKAEFPGLNALEFFHVFLADEAPYSFEEFQATRGDIDISYGKWNRWNGSDASISLYPNGNGTGGQPKLPTCSKKERELRFKTLTKSYFGPAYASAKKTQRVSKFSTRLVIIESKTELFDIPYSDRFFVLERWVVEAIKHESMVYTAKISVSVQVFMLKPCSWEKQIRSKTLPAIKDLVTCWTEKATKALELTLKRKLERMRSLAQNDGDRSIMSYKSKDSYMSAMSGRKENKISSAIKSEQRLMNMHQKRLKVLEKKIAAGDLEWCSIEMRHSLAAGKTNAYTEVLNPSDPTRQEPIFSGNSEEADLDLGNEDRPQMISIQKKTKQTKRGFRMTLKKKNGTSISKK
mmetsp:Transcript_4629/g.6435  ORF Transcript_4629/g.6435 Transcript_4629/m.6435 type:complete len:833 (+) Transcript_4629:407-2905(+)